MAAERPSGGGCWQGSAASMGPRPDGRGTLRLNTLGMAAAAELQWGRDRMAAERGRAPVRKRWVLRFNGAATGWPRNGLARTSLLVTG